VEVWCVCGVTDLLAFHCDVMTDAGAVDFERVGSSSTGALVWLMVLTVARECEHLQCDCIHICLLSSDMIVSRWK
jgi:hypothetical protein